MTDEYRRLIVRIINYFIADGNCSGLPSGAVKTTAYINLIIVQ